MIPKYLVFIYVPRDSSKAHSVKASSQQSLTDLEGQVLTVKKILGL